MSSIPQVSIGLLVFNGENYLRQAVDSLLAQQFADFELIISDNGSTDRTQLICQDYAIRDPRVKYVRSETNHGPIWNFNHVFELASADYFMWASHDDYWHPFYLQACVDILKKSDSIVLAASLCDCMNSDLSKVIVIDVGVTTVGLTPKARYQCYKIYVADDKINSLFYGVYRRKILDKVMPIKNIMGPDYVPLAELSLLGEFFIVQEILMKKRSGGDSENLTKAINSLQINISFGVRHPHLIREFYLQRAIFRSSQFDFFNKVMLSMWSWGNFMSRSIVHRMSVLQNKPRSNWKLRAL